MMLMINPESWDWMPTTIRCSIRRLKIDGNEVGEVRQDVVRL